jgi:NAD(P)-dependent dehydrogenase (short-subunit alcohol dehydrogenase family)
MAPAEPTLEQGDSMSRLAGKIAIVTGTSPNIGGGIAQGLADEGAAVVCVDIVPENAPQCADC